MKESIRKERGSIGNKSRSIPNKSINDETRRQWCNCKLSKSGSLVGARRSVCLGKVHSLRFLVCQRYAEKHSWDLVTYTENSRLDFLLEFLMMEKKVPAFLVSSCFSRSNATKCARISYFMDC